jgi:hypothetical protein
MPDTRRRGRRASTSGPDSVDFEVDLDQLYAMAIHAREAVVAGRPQCPRCALPLDPEGHVCPASNGDLRRHRP